VAAVRARQPDHGAPATAVRSWTGARHAAVLLAAYQGREDDEFTDQKPGKILHEYRRGEMAACREIVFIPYYGSVDATPLFLILVAAYLRWTNDRQLLSELSPAIEAALDWIERSEYLTYASRSAQGLVNQGWKDSHDAIMHEDGEPAAGPITLVRSSGLQVRRPERSRRDRGGDGTPRRRTRSSGIGGALA
jgi:hypothetical protein